MLTRCSNHGAGRGVTSMPPRAGFLSLLIATGCERRNWPSVKPGIKIIHTTTLSTCLSGDNRYIKMGMLYYILMIFLLCEPLRNPQNIVGVECNFETNRCQKGLKITCISCNLTQYIMVKYWFCLHCMVLETVWLQPFVAFTGYFFHFL